MFEDTVVVISFQNTMPPFTVYSKVMDSTAIHSINHHPADRIQLISLGGSMDLCNEKGTYC